MGLQPSLQVEYSHPAELRQRPTAWWRDVLGLIHFDAAANEPPHCDIPTTQIHAPVLGEPRDGAEVWRLTGELHSGQRGRLRFRHNGELLFATLSVSESDFGDDAERASAAALRRATTTAYNELFNALAALGFAQPLRIWNFLPDINGAVGDGERYWHFNGGRQEAFAGSRRSLAGNVPAASAVGAAASSPLTVYCIASAAAPIPLENPRQISAWDYPSQYGPRSPTFARACIAGARMQVLFISGTASIVGHASIHLGDARAQTLETVRNIGTLVDAANERLGTRRYALERLHYKVYVRSAADQPLIEQALRGAVGAQAPVLYLQADICRRDLLVEIEAVGI